MRPRTLDIFSAAAVLAGLLFAACGREAATPVAPEDALATVDGQVIRVEDFESQLQRPGSRAMRRLSNVEQREAMLDELIRFEVLAANARKAGYDSDPELLAAFDRLMVKRFQEDQLSARLDALSVSDAEIEAWYDEHLESEYTIPEAVRAGVIFLQLPPGVSPQKREEIAARAAEAHAEVSGGEAFATVATRYSDDRATRYQGGDAGWLSPGDRSRWEPGVVEVAFALGEPGQLAPVFEGERGLYLVQLIARRPSSARPLAKVSDAIRYRLLRERRQSLEEDFFAEMRRNVKVEINRELLESIPLADVAAGDGGERRPPQLPSGQVQR